MKFKFPLVAVFVAMLSLTACGGGSTNNTTVAVASPAQLNKIDTLVGTGAEATSGKTATVTYTGYLYSDTAANHKGVQFESSSFSFTLGASGVISGFDQGVLGMKVGGKRTIEIPASLAYGTTGSPPAIPPNSGLVFDLELTKID